VLNTAGRERLCVQKKLRRRSHVRHSTGGRNRFRDPQRNRIGPDRLGVANGSRLSVSASTSTCGWVPVGDDKNEMSDITAVDDRRH
jgi:hypothetical protein